MCTSRNYYIQPCPPGTKNRPLRGYNDDERFVNFESFCDVNLVNFGYHHPQIPKYHNDIATNRRPEIRNRYDTPVKPPPRDRKSDFIAQTEYMYKNPHKYISDPLMHRESYNGRDMGIKHNDNEYGRGYQNQEHGRGFRHQQHSEERIHEAKYVDAGRPKDYRPVDRTIKDRINKPKEDKGSYLYMVISMPKAMVSKIKDYEAGKIREEQKHVNYKGEKDKGSMAYHKSAIREYGPMSRSPYSDYMRHPHDQSTDKAFYNSKDHGAAHYPPVRPPRPPSRHH